MQIIPRKDKYAIILRFTVESVRFSFHPIPGGKWENRRDKKLAEAIVTKIENDVAAGNFDPSLVRYRHKSTPQNVSCQKPAAATKNLTWLQVWDEWVSSLLNLKPSTKADHYQCVRRAIEKADNPFLKDVGWLQKASWAASTFNRRLSMLRSAIAHSVGLGKISIDPLAKITAREGSLEEEEAAESKKQPFTNEESSQIILAFEKSYPSYAPFVEFLFYTGARTGEAVGIRWRDIDLDRRLISITHTLTRERGGYKKTRKRPKTLQSMRSLKMSTRIYDVITKIKSENTDVDALIFKSPKGHAIDHGNFRKIWKAILEELGIVYRKPYATRHTLLSKALEGGLSIPQVAGIAGHKDGRMILQHYGRVINQPHLPE